MVTAWSSCWPWAEKQFTRWMQIDIAQELWNSTRETCSTSETGFCCCCLFVFCVCVLFCFLLLPYFLYWSLLHSHFDYLGREAFLDSPFHVLVLPLHELNPLCFHQFIESVHIHIYTKKWTEFIHPIHLLWPLRSLIKGFPSSLEVQCK